MVPPPDNMGEFPDFDSMTPQEQMAWLESLAKRQGVGEDELTTSADMEIAEVSADAVIDEPGYVPFEGSRSARRMKEEAEEMAEAVSSEAELEPEPEPAPEFEPEPELAEVLSGLETELPEEGFEEMDELVGAMAAESGEMYEEDPMQWLDDLSAQPDSGMDELEDFFAEVESDLDDSLAGAPPELAEAMESSAEPPPEVAPSEMEAAPVGEDDALGGMDPMLFLESLAKRQGVDPSQLTTSADMEVEEVAADAVIDEPGYVPFEGSRSARRMKEEAEAAGEAPELEPEISEVPEPEPEVSASVEPLEEAALLFEAEMPESVESEEELLSGADSMEWLETLAKRQGAGEEELLTEAALDIPELPEDTVIDEPGYVAYSPFSVLPSEGEAELPEEARAEGAVSAEEEEAELFEFEEAADDSLSWLEDLAAEPDEEFADMFAVEAEELEVEPEAPAPAPTSDDPLAGLSDEDIARMQAKGELTGHQELAWLKRQAAKLAEARETAEYDVVEEDVAPAEPAELPSWLEQMREESETVGELEAVEETELPAGLFEDVESEADIDISALALDTDELSPAEVDSLWAEPVEEEFELEEGPESELAAFLQGDLEPEADALADALDAEYERKALGDETEPEWYTEAVAKVAAEAPPVPEDVSPPSEAEPEPEVPAEPVVSEAVPVDMPDWLQPTSEEAPAGEAGAIADWLTAEPEAAPAGEGELPDWLQEQAPVGEPEGITDWLAEVSEGEVLEEAALDWVPDDSTEVAEAAQPEAAKAESAPAPAPESVPEPVLEPAVAPAPPPAPVAVSPARVEPEVPVPAPAAVPEGEQYAQYRQRLDADSNDHTARLELARVLRGQKQTGPCLDQYETLINASTMLQDVANDLTGLAGEQSKMPRIRRLLGDTYMRQGRLEEALDAYRSALNQL